MQIEKKKTIKDKKGTTVNEHLDGMGFTYYVYIHVNIYNIYMLIYVDIRVCHTYMQIYMLSTLHM